MLSSFFKFHFDPVKEILKMHQEFPVESYMPFFPQEVQCFYKICRCKSYHQEFTVRNFSGVLHALLPKNMMSDLYFNVEINYFEKNTSGKEDFHSTIFQPFRF